MAHASTTSTLPPGFRFGAYRVVEHLGSGGMAEVYRAVHLALQKSVALKILRPSAVDAGEGAALFLREAQAAAAIKHPNVVDITDVGVCDERPYIIMELLEGEDLQSYLQEHGALSEPELARVMLPVVAGLRAVHEAGVVHRDLKPGNIFLSRGADGSVVPKILDFGISRREKSVGEEQAPPAARSGLEGTPLYMSPEAARGSHELTPRSDQYALGVILYECLTGTVPFGHEPGGNLFSLLGAISRGEYKSPGSLRPALSPHLDVAIRRALSVEATQRFDSVAPLGAALWRVAAGRTQTLWAPLFGPALAASRGRPRTPAARRLGTPLLLALGATLVAGVGYLFVRGRPLPWGGEASSSGPGGNAADAVVSEIRSAAPASSAREGALSGAVAPLTAGTSGPRGVAPVLASARSWGGSAGDWPGAPWSPDLQPSVVPLALIGPPAPPFAPRLASPGTPGRRPKVRRPPRSRRTRVQSAPARGARGKGAVDLDDFMIEPSVPAQPEADGPRRGANGAPIFD